MNAISAISARLIGAPIPGSMRRTGAIDLSGRPVDLLVADSAISVLEIRERVKYSLELIRFDRT